MSSKVLICDERQFVRDTLAWAFSSKGHIVKTAKCAQECMAHLFNDSFDTLFVDVGMMGFDGIFVSRELRKHKKKTQIVLMAPFDSQQFEIDKLKPFSLDSVWHLSVKSAKESFKLIMFIDDQDAPLSILNDFRVGDSYEIVAHPGNNILIVDDQDSLRQFLNEFFSSEGFNITEAKNGIECVNNAIKKEFDAIFLDIRMPEMNGLDALQQMRQKGVQTPIFLMSGFGDVKSQEEAIQKGAQSFLAKPFKLSKALELVRSAEASF